MGSESRDSIPWAEAHHSGAAGSLFRAIAPAPSLCDSAFMKDGFRVESDSMGEMRVPAEALYGAQTARAVENFPISGLRFPRRFIRALGLIKKHAAAANLSLNLLTPEVARAIEQAGQ